MYSTNMGIISTIFLSIIFVCSIKAPPPPSLIEYDSFVFVLKKINSHQPVPFVPLINKLNSNKILSYAGCLLENLKFRSQTVKFTAIAPYDFLRFSTPHNRRIKHKNHKSLFTYC